MLTSFVVHFESCVFDLKEFKYQSDQIVTE